jgi:hypothetical protein
LQPRLIHGTNQCPFSRYGEASGKAHNDKKMQSHVYVGNP